VPAATVPATSFPRRPFSSCPEIPSPPESSRIVVDAGSYLPQSLGDLNPGAADSRPRDFIAVGGTTYFTAEEPTHGRELWKSGGSAATTVLLKDIQAGVGDSLPDQLTAFDGRLFFRACTAASGCELWVSDGTAAGTQVFKDLAPGSDSGNPKHLTVVGDNLWFSACEPATGCELWVSDGTAARTRRVADIQPGFASSNPDSHRSRIGEAPFVLSGGLLYFVADDGTGAELWATPLFLFDDGFESAGTSAWSAVSP
jgi:ELWxxDGT repeat protein